MTIRIKIPKEMETEMYYIQVKKYSPLTKGQTTKKKIRTWTSIHDIGNFYHGSRLTQEEYLHIEDKYVKTVNLYMDIYMDIGSDQKDETIIKQIENLGLYVNVIDYEYPNNFWTRSE